MTVATKYNFPEYFNFQSMLSAGQTCTDSMAGLPIDALNASSFVVFGHHELQSKEVSKSSITHYNTSTLQNDGCNQSFSTHTGTAGNTAISVPMNFSKNLTKSNIHTIQCFEKFKLHNMSHVILHCSAFINCWETSTRLSASSNSSGIQSHFITLQHFRLQK